MVRGYHSIKAAEVQRLCAGHLASCIERVNRVEPPISANLTVWKEYLGIRDLTLNIVQDSGKRKLLRDLTATLEAGFAKILARDAVLGKKIVFGTEMIEVRDVGLLWKRNSPPTPTDSFPTTGVTSKEGSVHN